MKKFSLLCSAFVFSLAVQAVELPGVPPGPVAPPATAGKAVAPEPSSGSAIYSKAVRSIVYIVCNKGQSASSGAGSILTPDGVILTNVHVINGADRCFGVLKPSGYGGLTKETPVYKLAVLAADPTKDLALVTMVVPPAGLVPLSIGAMRDVDVGQEVHAIGHPVGNLWTYTKGVVSQIRLQEQGVPPLVADVIQTQTPISPGNSGGPLLTGDGRLVGVNTWVRTDAQNLNFAVAVSEVHGFMDRVKRGQHQVKDFGGQAESSSGQEKPLECKTKVLGESRSKRIEGKIISMDIGCKGKANGAMLVPDDAGRERIFYVSTREPENGSDRYYDVRYYLDAKTGKILRSWHDVDRDGRPDYIGIHKNGEVEPSSFIAFNASMEN